MNKSQKKYERQVRESVERSFNNRYKSRGLPPPTLVHESTAPRNNTIPIVSSGNKVDVSIYEDFE